MTVFRGDDWQVQERKRNGAQLFWVLVVGALLVLWAWPEIREVLGW